MKIGFLSPRGTERNQSNSVFAEVYRELRYILTFSVDDIEFIPNLGLLAIASMLPPNEHELRYIRHTHSGSLSSTDTADTAVHPPLRRPVK